MLVIAERDYRRFRLRFNIDDKLTGLCRLAGLCTAQGKKLLGRHYADIGFATIGEETKVAWHGVGTAKLHRGHLVGILPVAHPSYRHMPVVGCIVESDGGIMVFSIVHPFRCFGLTLASELMTIERTYEILRCTATERATGIDVTDK